MSRGASEPRPGASRRGEWWKSAGRALLLLLGAAALIWLVTDAGPDLVIATLIGAGAFLPIIMACELGFVVMDVIALRLLLGTRSSDVPLAVWLRSGLMAYGIMILLPAGRAGGEVVRAAALAPHVGGARAAAGATLLQGTTLWGNTLISVPCWVAVALAAGPGSALAWLVLGNGVATAVLGVLVWVAARRSRLGQWLGTRIRFLSEHGARFDDALREGAPRPWLPVLAAFGGRAIQALQYGVILLAVGGVLTPQSALVAQAIHLVGAGLGDMVPNQVGITEGAYRIFGGALGLGDAAARAIGIALVHRICQVILAGTSLVVGAVWKPAPSLLAPGRREEPA